MIRSFFIVLLSLLAFAANAQRFDAIAWEASPRLHTVPDSFRNESAVIVLNETVQQYVLESDDLVQYQWEHIVARMLDEKGVESFNTTRIPAYAGIRIDSIRARAILPGGKVVNVPQTSIRMLKNEEGQDEYIFAFEGVVKGAEVEWAYRMKRSPTYFGIESVQLGIPTLAHRFVLSVPGNTRWRVKSSNGYPDARDTSLDEDRRAYYATAKNIPALEDEEYANKDLYRQRLEYKLQYMVNSEGDMRRTFTWDDLAQNLDERYATFKSAELSQARGLLKTMGVSKDEPVRKRILMIEDWMKTNIQLSEQVDEDAYASFSKIIEGKLSDEVNYTRLFCACLTAADVDFQVGSAPSRFKFRLDTAFENYRMIEDILVYIPSEKLFLSPTAVTLRAPFMPIPFAGATGIFAKQLSTGDGGADDATQAVAKFRTITLLPPSESSHDLDVTARFSPDMVPTLDYEQRWRGYAASGIRDIFTVIPKDKEKEVVSKLIDFVQKPEDIRSYSVANAAFNNYWDNKPFRIKATVQAENLVESAGNKYLFKVGDVIGRQSELYSDKKRRLPTDIVYMHSLNRKIQVVVPDGYRIANPDDVKMSIVYKDAQGAETMGFTADYEMKGNTMIITIHEDYNVLEQPVSAYDSFRKVINAAADFNKVTLVLEKR